MATAKLAVIGLGLWGERHCMTYLDHPHAELVAICDKNPDAVKAIGDKYGIERRFTDHNEMLSAGDLEIDGVSVVTPDFAHTDLAVAAIESGRNVLIEKPLATTVEECDKIGGALKKSPVKFMVDFHNRWNPGMLKCKKAIDEGEVGDVQMGYYRLSDNISVPTGMLSWAGKSTVNWFLASHCLDTLLWMLDDKITEVYTVSRSRVLKAMGVDTPDFYQSVLQFSKGATVVLENCWILARSHALIDFKVEIVGDKGTLFWNGRPHLVEQYMESEVEWPDVYVCPDVYGQMRGFGVYSIEAFADCVALDQEPLCGFEDGREVTRIIVAMEQSAERGKPVKL